MKAVVCYGDGVVHWEEVPTPTPGRGEVRIRVKACGICGSDIPRAMARGAHSYPIILGHEFSGVVDAVGEGVLSVQTGDRATAAPLIPCGVCEDCRAGDYAMCPNYSFVGSRQPGAMAEYVVVPVGNVCSLDASVSFEQGALIEPATVALHAVYLSGLKPGGTVAVLGGGTMGVFALQWARLMGAERIAVFGRDRGHLALSERLGADAVFSTLDSDFMAQAMALTGNRGFDTIYEAAGSTATMRYAFEMAAKKARLCFIGTPTEDLTFTPRLWERMNRREFTLTGSWMSCSAPFPGREWAEAARRFADGSLRFEDAMFHAKYPMREAQRAFDLFRTPERVKGRVLLVEDGAK